MIDLLERKEDRKRLPRIVIVGDQETSGQRLESIFRELSSSKDLNAVGQSQVKRSQIREIAAAKPDLVFINVDLKNPEQFDELCGFCGSLRYHLPRGKIVIQTRPLEEEEKRRIFSTEPDIGRQVEAAAWIDDQLPFETLGLVLSQIGKGRGVSLSPLIGPGKILRRQEWERTL